MQADKYFSISHLMKFSFKINLSVIQYIISSLKKSYAFYPISINVWILTLNLLFLQ